MTASARVLRILRLAALAVITLLALLFVLVQAQQHLLRHRAELLLADFQSIRIHQSTWVDAQVLMRRWGAWGHYEDQCTTSSCGYTITLGDAFSRSTNRIHTDKSWVWGLLHHLNTIFRFLGGKCASMQVSFLVQDGTIWRSSVALGVDVPPSKDDKWGYGLSIGARASDSLHQKFDFSRGRGIGP